MNPFENVRHVVKDSARALKLLAEYRVYLKRHEYRLLLLIIVSLAGSAASLLAPLLTQSVIDTAYPKRDLHMFAWLAAGIAGTMILGGLLGTAGRYLSLHVQVLLESMLCLRVVEAIHRAPLPFVERTARGVFVERASSDVNSLSQSLVQLMPQLAAMSFTIVASVGLMLRLDVTVTVLILAIMPVSYGLISILAGKLRKLGVEDRAVAEKISTFVAESIDGAATIRLYDLSRQRRTYIVRLLRERLGIAFGKWKAFAFWGQANAAVVSGWGFAFLCGGWILVFMDRLQLGEAVALGMYVGIMARPFAQLAGLYQSMMMASVSAERVHQILKERPTKCAVVHTMAINQGIHCIELSKVGFSYPGKPHCLKGLDLSIRRGEVIAVIGPSGAGKSSLLRLFADLEQDYDGAILVNGHDIRSIPSKEYYRSIALVPQDDMFFSQSIWDNLGPKCRSIDPKRIAIMAGKLGLSGVIDSQPGGYHAVLGPAGTGLSAGEYKRLAILRALLKAPDMLLLDEMTSCLDIQSERKVLLAVKEFRAGNGIVVLVTHRLNITEEPWISRVVVLNEGHVAEAGAPGELYEKGGLYREWMHLYETKRWASPWELSCNMSD